MSISLQQIEALIQNDQKKEARQALKAVLKNDPSADAWYLTALAVDDDQQKIKCLREALKLDEFHTPANRLLYKVEGGIPQAEREKRKNLKVEQQNIPVPQFSDREMKKDRHQKHRERQKQRNRLGCLFSLLLSASCSMFAFSAIGMFPGFIGAVTGFLGGPAAVY